MPGGNICSQSKNYGVKFGPRRETVKEIIEADPMKEVLHLRATFAPTPTQQIVKFGPRRETMKEVLWPGASFAPTQKIMLSNLGQGGTP